MSYLLRYSPAGADRYKLVALRLMEGPRYEHVVSAWVTADELRVLEQMFRHFDPGLKVEQVAPGQGDLPVPAERIQ